MKTGLFFGSFNPIHIGHLAIANYFVEFTGIQQLWFVVSPHNPFKKKESLLDDYQRLELVHRAIGKDERYWACDIEFNMPKPSYTIDTLAYLEEKYPKREFVLIMGSDGIPSFYKWKNAGILCEKYQRFVYPRPGFDMNKEENETNRKNTRLVNAPLMEISSTFIRDAIKNNKDVRYFLPNGLYDYIEDMGFYK